MAGFLPADSNLGSIQEYKGFSHTITYTDTLNVSHPVTITVEKPNATVITSGGTIKGHYSFVYNGTIKYRTKDDRFVEVSRWSDIDKAIANNTLSEIYFYYADGTRTVLWINNTEQTVPWTNIFNNEVFWNRFDYIFGYIATANGESRRYTITVNNNWTVGRDELAKYFQTEEYNNIVLGWTSSTGTVSFTNSLDEETAWTT
jgi:hypothetical protein